MVAVKVQESQQQRPRVHLAGLLLEVPCRFDAGVTGEDGAGGVFLVDQRFWRVFAGDDVVANAVDVLTVVVALLICYLRYSRQFGDLYRHLAQLRVAERGGGERRSHCLRSCTISLYSGGRFGSDELKFLCLVRFHFQRDHLLRLISGLGTLVLTRPAVCRHACGEMGRPCILVIVEHTSLNNRDKEKQATKSTNRWDSTTTNSCLLCREELAHPEKREGAVKNTIQTTDT